MTCRELLDRFVKALERDELDREAMHKLMHKCGEHFAMEAIKAAARKVVQFAVSEGWLLYRGSRIAGMDISVAYGRAVHMIWHLYEWLEMDCEFLGDIAAYVAEAVSKYAWPKWPFLAVPAVVAEERGCTLPDAVAEALGPDEYARLEAFLEEDEGVVELEKGLKAAVVRDGLHVSMVV